MKTNQKTGRNRRWLLLLAVLLVPAGPAVAGVREHTASGLVHQDAGFFIWTENSLHKIPRVADPAATAARPPVAVTLLSAAGDERQSFNLVITPRGETPLPVEALVFEDLRGPGGARLPASAFSGHSVGYVQLWEHERFLFPELLADPARAGKHYPDVLFPALLWPEAAPGENYNLWITVHVPRDTPAGRYEGRLRLTVAGREFPVPLAVQAWGFNMPRRAMVETQLFALGAGGISGEGLARFFDDVPAVKRRAFELYAERRFSHSWPTPEMPPGHFPLPPRVADGRHGAGLRLRGGGIEEPGSHALDPAALTVSAWFQPDPAGRDHVLVARGPRGQGEGFHLRALLEGERLAGLEWRLDLADGEPVILRAALDRPAGRWHHAAATWDRRQAVLYLDGEAVATGGERAGRPAPAGHPVGIGTYGGITAYGREAVRGDFFYHGLLDEVRLYGRALSAAEVAADAAAAAPLPGVLLARDFTDFDDDILAVSPLLPAAHLLGARWRDYYFRWVDWWHQRGLFLGRLPFRGRDREQTELFFEVYVTELRRRGLMDRLWARLPFDEAFRVDRGEERALQNIETGRFWRQLAPDLRTHMTVAHLYWRDTDEAVKMEILREFAPALGIYSLQPACTLPFPRVRRFLREQEVSWYVHHNMNIHDPAVFNRLFFWKMWQEGVSQITLWSTTLWSRADTDIAPGDRGFRYRTRWFGNAVLFWPGPGQAQVPLPGAGASGEKIVPALRADLMRDGIQDWEYHRLLRELFNAVDDDALERELYYGISYALDMPVNLDLVWRCQQDFGLAGPGNVIDLWAHDEPALIERVLAHRARVARYIEILSAMVAGAD